MFSMYSPGFRNTYSTVAPADSQAKCIFEQRQVFDPDISALNIPKCGKYLFEDTKPLGSRFSAAKMPASRSNHPGDGDGSQLRARPQAVVRLIAQSGTVCALRFGTCTKRATLKQAPRYVAKLAWAVSRVRQLGDSPCLRVLHVRHRHDLDDLDPPARHHLQVGMGLAEELCGCVVGLRLDDGIASNAVLRIRGSLRVDALGLAERRTALNDRLLVLLHPFHPGIQALLLLFGRRAIHRLLEVGTRCHVQNHEFFHLASSRFDSARRSGRQIIARNGALQRTTLPHLFVAVPQPARRSLKGRDTCKPRANR